MIGNNDDTHNTFTLVREGCVGTNRPAVLSHSVLPKALIFIIFFDSRTIFFYNAPHPRTYLVHTSPVAGNVFVFFSFYTRHSKRALQRRQRLITVVVLLVRHTTHGDGLTIHHDTVV